MAKQPIPLHQALVRPLLLGGGEREPMVVVVGTGLGLLAIAWQTWSLLATAVGLICLFAIAPKLVKIAKQDPKAFAVYKRYMKYPPYYPARSSPHGKG